MLAISLALGASVCYGVSNFLGPQLARRHATVDVLIVSQLAALVGCVVYLAGDHGPALAAAPTAYALLAGVGNAFGLILFYKAAELGPVSVVAPIGATGAVVPVVWGLATGDSLHATEAAGLVLALAGAVLAARRPADEEPSVHPDPRMSAILAAISAVAFGVFLTALPSASEHGRAWTLLDARVALVVLLFIWARRELPSIRGSRDTRAMTIPGLLLLAGTLLYATAADHGQLSLVSVLGSLFPVVTVGLGVTLAGERLAPVQVVGITSAIAGVVLISL